MTAQHETISAQSYIQYTRRDCYHWGITLTSKRELAMGVGTVGTEFNTVRKRCACDADGNLPAPAPADRDIYLYANTGPYRATAPATS